MTLTQNDVLQKTGVTYEPVPGVVVQQATAAATSTVSSVGGVVGSTGTITAGTQFTVNHTGTGTYTITFTTAFASTPTVVASVSGVDLLIAVSSISTTGFNVTIHTTAAGGSDTAFSFLASAIA